MPTSASNGVRVGPVTVLVRETERKRTPLELLKDMAIGLFLSQYAETVDWLVSVHSLEPGDVLARRQFDRRRRAEQARADLVAAARASADLDRYDWQAVLDRV